MKSEFSFDVLHSSLQLLDAAPDALDFHVFSAFSWQLGLVQVQGVAMPLIMICLCSSLCQEIRSSRFEALRQTVDLF